MTKLFYNLLRSTPHGLYCPEGDFYIDPQVPVARAVITHAHADHARPGSQKYLCSDRCLPLAKLRLQHGANIQSLPFGQKISMNKVSVSLLPAGHITGSAQVLLESNGRRALVTGDFKRHADPLTHAYEPAPAHLLVMETTFALPIFAWQNCEHLQESLLHWVARNRAEGYTSVILAYALGKAQQVCHYLAPLDVPLLAHGSVRRFQAAFSKLGLRLPALESASEEKAKTNKGAIVVAPPSVQNTSWLDRFRPYRTCFASGWMTIRGNRRRRNVDFGLALSDHADWDGLVSTVNDVQPEIVWTTHGYAETFARFLAEERGTQACSLEPHRPKNE
jgi:putative mRNA 3-end processing factor